MAQRLSLARETVVDEATILLTRDRRAYAEALLAFSSPQPHLPGVTPLIGRRHLSQRISLIVEEEVMSRGRTFASFAGALLISAAATSSAISAFPMTAIPLTGDTQRPRVYTSKDDGVTLPIALEEVKPEYTREAMQQGIQGSVWMETVVLESGSVGEVQISKSLDAEYGLDRQAIEATKRWKFKPGTKDGRPVAFRVTIEMTFTLK